MNRNFQIAIIYRYGKYINFLLFQDYNFVHLSAGQLLRDERNSGSKDGSLINRYIKEGKIVPVEITVRLLEKVCEFIQTQSAFTCSKSTIETLEQGVKYVNNKDTRTPKSCNVIKKRVSGTDVFL